MVLFNLNTAVKTPPKKENTPSPSYDRFSRLLFFANEIGKSSLLESKRNRQKQWTPEKRAQQAQKIRTMKPWLKATGPKTKEGKAKSALNAVKYTLFRDELKSIRHLLKYQRQTIRKLEDYLIFRKQVRRLKSLSYATRMSMNTLGDIYKITRTQFQNLENAELEARRLIEGVTGMDSADFITHKDRALSPEHISLVKTYAERRLAGEPLSKILGMKEFWGLEFLVSRDTLDPRPDTETLIEAVLDYVGKENLNKPLRIIDLGTGTGCIPISLLSELPHATAVAVDISDEALHIARQNADKHKMSSRIKFVKGDWLTGFEKENFDIYVSNPPYIPNLDIESLSPEVKNHDPFLALEGGKDGLKCYKIIFSQLKNKLNGKNRAFFEIGFGQLESLQGLVEDSNLLISDSRADLAGIPRVIEITCGDK